MPPISRLPTVEFRSLLLPPTQVPLRALRSLYRPQCHSPLPRTARPPHCLVQRRFLNLYLTAKAKTVLGMHKVIPFELYDAPELSEVEHKVNLVVSETDPTVIASDITFQELYDKHVKPGQMLYLTNELKKGVSQNFTRLREENTAAEARDYAIVPAKSRFVHMISPPQNSAQLNALKAIHITLANPVPYYKLALDRAYQFIENGSPVEFHIRAKGSYVGKEKMLPGPPDVWPYIHNHFAHVRPDFIKKAMPKGTIYLIKPVSDGKQCEFVLTLPAKQMPNMDLTERLFKVKNAVAKAIHNDVGIQLPKKAISALAPSRQAAVEAAIAKAASKGQDEGQDEGEIAEAVRSEGGDDVLESEDVIAVRRERGRGGGVPRSGVKLNKIGAFQKEDGGWRGKYTRKSWQDIERDGGWKMDNPNARSENSGDGLGSMSHDMGEGGSGDGNDVVREFGFRMARPDKHAGKKDDEFGDGEDTIDTRRNRGWDAPKPKSKSRYGSGKSGREETAKSSPFLRRSDAEER